MTYSRLEFVVNWGMDKLTQMRVFVRVAERASFSAVARELSTTQSAISKAIAALETGLGIRLVNRSTRSVALTEAGTLYHARCRQWLADLDEAESSLQQGLQGATGTLCIAAPVPFGLMFISPRVARFKADHPGLNVQLWLTDVAQNLVEHNIDVAVRLGHLHTPGLAARKLGHSPFVCVAAPGYVAARGNPTTLEDLAQHNCLAYGQQLRALEWKFLVGQDVRAVAISSNYQSNNLLALKDAAMAGLGIAQLPLWMVDTDIRCGQLQLVLPKRGVPPFDIHAVFPSVRRIPPKVRLFVDFIQRELKSVSYLNFA